MIPIFLEGFKRVFENNCASRRTVAGIRVCNAVAHPTLGDSDDKCAAVRRRELFYFYCFVEWDSESFESFGS